MMYNTNNTHKDDNINIKNSFTAYTLQLDGLDTPVDSTYVTIGVYVSLVIARVSSSQLLKDTKRVEFLRQKVEAEIVSTSQLEHSLVLI